MTNQLIDVSHVTKEFSSGFFNKKQLRAVQDVSLTIVDDLPQTITVAGESGSGKTTLAQMILGFQSPTSGEIRYRGQNVHRLGASRFQEFRKRVQAISQNPFDAFNPFYPVDHALVSPIKRFHLADSRQAAEQMIHSALSVVRLDPAETLGRYPHQLSGGQLQRIMIARALLLKPKLIVADEPVSMIDVSLRAIILDILIQLKEQFGISLIYITHDLSTALQISDRIMIMYRGHVVEQGEVASVIENPLHPYTQLLVSAIPLPDPDRKWGAAPPQAWRDEQQPAGGRSGCIFYDRCPQRMPVCSDNPPPEFTPLTGHHTRCFLYESTPQADVAAPPVPAP